jgi:hypothetical protein
VPKRRLESKDPDQYRREAGELSWMANAYLTSAVRLCDDILKQEWERSPHHCCVVLHLAYLALELWLKAGISAARRPYSRGHDLSQLRNEYLEVHGKRPLPIPSYFERLIPHTHDLFSDYPAPLIEQLFPQLRYASDGRGHSYPDLELPDMRALSEELDSLHIAAAHVQREIWIEYDVLK